MKDFMTNLLHIWSNASINVFEQHEGRFPLKMTIFDQLAEINGSVISIHNLQDLGLVHITPNVSKMLGITQEQAAELGNNHFMSRLHKAHNQYLAILFGFIQEIAQQTENIDFSKMRAWVCGVQYMTENGDAIRLLLDYSTLPPLFQHEKPTHCLGILYNVSHLYKRDDFWIRFVYQMPDGEIRTKSFHPDFGIAPTGDFISAREQEILEYIHQGFDTMDIAQKLHISPNTVNNHRQKLLDKLGAKDTTALLLLAQKICYKS